MNVEQQVSDAIIEKPIEFSLNKEKYKIHPPTFGKLQMLSKLYLQLEIDEGALMEEPHLEAMRVCKAKTDVVCEIMSVATFKDKQDLLNDDKIKERAEHFKWNTKPSDFSTILLALLTQTHYENFMSSIRLTGILRQNKPRD